MAVEHWIIVGIFCIALATVIYYFELWIKKNKDKHPLLFKYRFLIMCGLYVGLDSAAAIIRVLN
ncbi:hypothetical protein PKOR_11745 [Pontibacter korlensis]|uniref:Uncharacterized protein n=1 Tax=Pontibacter korlensis TaxID=400092 RepID=A0A0E3UWU3_9BACT|nr:hypothetical protein PKOR_11745 [Pontibacter korlensis]